MTVWNGIIPPGPAEDADLDALLQALVVGVTGIGGPLVRPRWQPNPPKQPEPGVDWCAIGVTGSEPDDYPYIEHLSGAGIDEAAGDMLVTHEMIEVLVSFYGPNAKANSDVLRDGLKISQNLFILRAVDVAFTDASRETVAPELVNQQWVRRYDRTLRFKRKVTRIYGVQNIIAADVHLFDDSGHVDDTVRVDSP